MEVNGIIVNPQSGSAGTHVISVSIASVNEGIDKEVRIDGVCGDKESTLTVVHEGMRHPFGLNGGGVFRLAGGGRFGVLKEDVVNGNYNSKYTGAEIEALLDIVANGVNG